MGASNLLELAQAIDQRRKEAQDLEAVARAGLEYKGSTPQDLRNHYSQIERCSEIKEKCDAAMVGLVAVVDLVTMGVMKAEEL